MGSAFASVLARAGHDVRLWGTHLDTVIVGQLRDGQPHPRTRVALPSTVEIMEVRQLKEAVHAAELVVLAVSSEGALPTLTLTLPVLAGEPVAMLVLTKGLALSPEGRVELFNEAIMRVLSAHMVDMPIVGVGGPCKANEVAVGRPTISVLAADRPDVAHKVAAMVSTSSYMAIANDDIVGIEASAALKNLYAIALGVCDGLTTKGGQPWHDLRAAVFTQALSEMGWIVGSLGGRPQTVHGLAGIGDLDVTALSGRNRAFGERLGRGETVRAAHQAMVDAGHTIEGLAVAGLARRLVLERVGDEALEALPLLDLLTSALIRVDEALDDSSRLTTAAFIGLRHPRAFAGAAGGISDGHQGDASTATAPVSVREPREGHAAAKGGATDTDR